ncbi:beta-lactamase family protein [Streptomyces sp. WAC06614]|uniref:beta-lactamase family protein n=1 Tax=Streptomyces sp. WAC06614 TaxID=2487416 RepID=UPI0021AFE4E9
MDLDAPASRYLPGLLPDSFTPPPTVRHLLTFTSGLRPGADLGETPPRCTRTASRRSPRSRSSPPPWPKDPSSPRGRGRSTRTSTTPSWAR